MNVKDRTRNMQTRVLPLCRTLLNNLWRPVYRGCKRFAHEIVDWNRYDDHQKGAVLTRLTQLLTTVVGRYVLVVDHDLLKGSSIDMVPYRKDQPQNAGRMIYLGRPAANLRV